MLVQRFQADDAVILDWYDGIVSAAISIEGRRFFLFLAAWRLESQKKAFILIEMSVRLAESVEAFTTDSTNAAVKSEKWNEFINSFRESLHCSQNNAYVIYEEPVVGIPFSARVIGIEQLQQIKGYGVEQAVTEDATRNWLD